MSTRLEQTLRAASSVLNQANIPFAVVGGIAVSLRSEERTTRDIDLAVAVSSDAAAEEVVRTMQQHGFSLIQALEQVATARLATVRLQPSDEGRIVVDLIFASSPAAFGR